MTTARAPGNGGKGGNGKPNEKLRETPAWAELAIPTSATAATKLNRCFVFMEGSTAQLPASSIPGH